MHDFTHDDIYLEAIRERIKKMSGEMLVAYGQSAARMAEHNGGETWKVQLAEILAEWRRRFKKPSG